MEVKKEEGERKEGVGVVGRDAGKEGGVGREGR